MRIVNTPYLSTVIMVI